MMPDLARVVQKLVAPLQRRVRLMVARAVVQLVTESTRCQTLQLIARADELSDAVERFQEYGFSSVPAPGAEALVVAVGGNTSHSVVIATEDRRTRPTDLAEGEVALWTKDHGKRMHAKANGEVHIGTTPADFVALATLVHDEIDALRTTVNDLITAYNAHTHSGVTSSACTAGGATGTCTVSSTPSTAVAPAAVGDVAATEVKAK